MEIRVYQFLDDPRGYINKYRGNGTIYPWLVNLLGEDATCKIFTDLVFQAIQKKREDLFVPRPLIVSTSGGWVDTVTVAGICDWGASPQKLIFWEVPHNYHHRGTPLHESDKEWLLDTCYSVSIPGFILVPAFTTPPWANDVFIDVPF